MVMMLRVEGNPGPLRRGLPAGRSRRERPRDRSAATGPTPGSRSGSRVPDGSTSIRPGVGSASPMTLPAGPAGTIPVPSPSQARTGARVASRRAGIHRAGRAGRRWVLHAVPDAGHRADHRVVIPLGSASSGSRSSCFGVDRRRPAEPAGRLPHGGGHGRSTRLPAPSHRRRSTSTWARCPTWCPPSGRTFSSSPGRPSRRHTAGGASAPIACRRSARRSGACASP